MSSNTIWTLRATGWANCVHVCAGVCLYNEEGMRDKQRVVQENYDGSQMLTEFDLQANRVLK